jgi:hypothetical protein
MKVSCQLERSCCKIPDDIRRYHGINPVSKKSRYNDINNVYFCMHCGQLWKWARGQGEMDYGWAKIQITDYVI